MPSLLDIARNLRKTVAIGDATISVRGLTAEEIARLLASFPELQQLVGGRGGDFSLHSLMDKAPDAVATILAIATSEEANAVPADSEVEGAKSLPGAVVTDLLLAVAELSLPRALMRPFVQLWQDLGETMSDAVAASGRDPATK